MVKHHWLFNVSFFTNIRCFADIWINTALYRVMEAIRLIGGTNEIKKGIDFITDHGNADSWSGVQ